MFSNNLFIISSFLVFLLNIICLYYLVFRDKYIKHNYTKIYSHLIILFSLIFVITLVIILIFFIYSYCTFFFKIYSNIKSFFLRIQGSSSSNKNSNSSSSKPSGSGGSSNNNNNNNNNDYHKNLNKDRDKQKKNTEELIKWGERIKEIQQDSAQQIKMGNCNHDNLGFFNAEKQEEVNNTFCDMQARDSHKAFQGVNDFCRICNNCNALICRNCYTDVDPHLSDSDTNTK